MLFSSAWYGTSRTRHNLTFVFFLLLLLLLLLFQYTDNVLKGQATAVSVVLASGFSTIFFHTYLSAYYWLGTTLILIAVFVFSNPVEYTVGHCCGGGAADAPKRQEVIPLTDEIKDDV
jgi:drug/metabolite transporter (DMT)-like permease